METITENWYGIYTKRGELYAAEESHDQATAISKLIPGSTVETVAVVRGGDLAAIVTEVFEASKKRVAGWPKIKG